MMDAVGTYLESGHILVKSLYSACGAMWRVKEHLLMRTYEHEVSHLEDLIHRHQAIPAGLLAMLANAPSIKSLEQFYRLLSFHPDVIIQCQATLMTYIQNYDFSSPFIDSQAEINGLIALFKYGPESVASEDLMCCILKSERFVLS